MIAAALVLAGCGGGQRTISSSASPASPDEQLTFSVVGARPSPELARADAAVLFARLRLARIPVEHPVVGAGRITFAVPLADARSPYGAQGRLRFYDWELNVIGPDGQPAGTADPQATGGTAGPGTSTYGVNLYDAVIRASRRPAIIGPEDTTLGRHCTEALSASTGCLYGEWFLVDDSTRAVLDSFQETEAELYAAVPKADAHDKLRAVLVKPGTIVVQAVPDVNDKGDVTNTAPNSYYVLADNPFLGGTAITSPVAGTDPNSGLPDVTFGLTDAGQTVFEAVTKEIAQRGLDAQVPDSPKPLQHLAVVLDNQLISVPSIDFTIYPDGIDATMGSEISGGFTPSTARALAILLQTGPLPQPLALVAAKALG